MAKKKNPANVSVGKPKAGGAVFLAPAGTPVPTDAKSELPEEFACLGCINEDGVVNTQSTESEEFSDWEGDVVETTTSKFSETYKMTFIEAINVDVLKFVYGDANVDVTAGGGIHVRHNGSERDEAVMVVDTILKGRRVDRLVVPRAKVSEIGDITRKKSELIGYEATVKALSDDGGDCTHEYIDELPEPGAAEQPSVPEQGGDE